MDTKSINEKNKQAEFTKKVYQSYKDGILFLFENKELDTYNDSFKKEYYKVITLLDQFYDYFKSKVDNYRGLYNNNKNKADISNYIDMYEQEYIGKEIKSCIFNEITIDEYFKNKSIKSFSKLITQYKKFTEEDRQT